MGLEAICRASFGGRCGEGKAHLEPAELVFRGDFRLRIPVPAVTSVDAKKGQLRVVWPEGDATFELGPAAEKWATTLRYPRPVLDKLGVKQGARIAVLGQFKSSFLSDLARRSSDVSKSRPRKDTDLVFVAMTA